MKINQTTKFDNKAGDFVVLTDYGSEGLSVQSQHKTPEEAIRALSSTVGAPQVIVKLVDFQFEIVN